MITGTFELELLCFMREFEEKRYSFFMVRQSFEGHPTIELSVTTPGALKYIKAKQSYEYEVNGKTYYKSSQEDLEQFMCAVRLHDKVYNKRAA